MSIKIYDAYRFSLAKLNQFTEAAHGAMRSKAQEHFNQLVEALVLDVPTLTHVEAAMKVHQFIRSASKEHPILDCGFRFWIDDEFQMVYAQFWGLEIARPSTFPAWVEEYHYQNSADRPDSISEEAWNQRYLDWKRVCMERFWIGRFNHPVIDNDSHSITDLMDTYIRSKTNGNT